MIVLEMVVMGCDIRKEKVVPMVISVLEMVVMGCDIRKEKVVPMVISLEMFVIGTTLYFHK